MIRINRNIMLEWKLNPSLFELANSKVFSPTTQNLTGSITSVKKMLSYSEELSVLMPTLIGKAKADLGWQKDITDYFNSLIVAVPKIGLELNISYSFSYNRSDADFKTHLNEYCNLKGIDVEALVDKSDVERERELAAYISGAKGESFKCTEEELYKLVIFENIKDYVTYRYALVSNVVANSAKDVNKSEKIKFVLVDENITKEEEAANHRIAEKALKAYLDVSNKSEATIDNYMIAFELVSSIDDLTNSSENKKLSKLLSIATNNPSTFNTVYADKNVDIKAMIQKYIWFNILVKHEVTGIITDASEPDRVLGNSIVEVVAFFNNPVNKALIQQYEAQYNSLTK